MSEEKRHSKLGASSAHRWLSCAASIELAEKAPPAPPSAAADEGTLAHEWFEYVIRTEILKEKNVTKPKVSREMENFVQEAVNFVEAEFMPELGDELIIEEELDLSWIDPTMFGTLDVGIVRIGGKLSIIDLKFGFGWVDAVENEQLLYYALALAKKYDFNFTEVEMTIAQPRAGGDTIRSWNVPIETVKNFEYILKKGAQRVKRGGNKPFAGEWCKFCRAAVICPAHEARALQAAKDVFDDDGFGIEEAKSGKLVFPDPRDLAPEVISKVLGGADLLEDWIGNVRKYAEDVITRGGVIPGWGMVPKRATRQWTEEGERIVGQDADAWKKVLMSPNELEKAIGKKEVEKHYAQYIEKISSGLKLGRLNETPKIGGTRGEEKSQEENGKEKSNKKEGGKKGKAKKEKSVVEKAHGFEDGDFDFGF